MNKSISYVIVTKDCSISCDAQDEQLNLWDVLTLEECENLAAMGIEIFLQ